MSAVKVFLCIVFIACGFTGSRAQHGRPMDCCLEVKDKEMPKALVANYHKQVAGKSCKIEAVVLVTRRGQSFCMPPDQQWVLDTMKHVDRLHKKCKSKKYKGRSCFGVKP